jgi:retron-type reverse transcriptase
LAQVADPERLIESFKWVRQHGGPAVGTDNVKFTDIGRRDMPDLMRTLSKLLLDGDYTPGPRRRLAISKPSGGTRTLAIPDLLERVVTRSLLVVLTPYWEKIFHPWSLGFRPRRRTWHLLLAIEQGIRDGRHVLLNVDIKQAFDNVGLNDIMKTHRRHLADANLADLIMAILRGNANLANLNTANIRGEAITRRGIAQGSAYSPTALNVLLHHHLDEPLIGTGNATPWRRYADNLVYLCYETPEAQEARRQTVRLLSTIGMTLKEQLNTMVDLTQPGTFTDLLGYRLTMEGGELQISTMPTSWDSLRLALRNCHDTDNPRVRAMETVNGWTGYQAPGFGGTTDATSQRIIQMATESGIRTIDATAVHKAVTDAWDRWTLYRENGQLSLDDLAVAPPTADNFFSVWDPTGVVADASLDDLGSPVPSR